jgi:hypothetical protein
MPLLHLLQRMTKFSTDPRKFAIPCFQRSRVANQRIPTSAALIVPPSLRITAAVGAMRQFKVAEADVIRALSFHNFAPLR